MPRFLRYALSLSLCCVGSQLYAQKALTELYGEGVHRYFAGDSFQADQMFSRVIESGVQDPLVYYFRGLVREYQGDGGDVDFEEGARLEAAGKRSLGLRNGVGDALARIQGHTRIKIEKARRDARIAAELQAQLMQGPSETAGEVAPPSTVPDQPPVVPPTDPTDSFGEPAADDMPAPAVAPEPGVEPEVDTESDPFADDTAVPPAADSPAADTPAADTPADPFGTDPATPPADDPFGTDAATPPADDPFGTDAATPPAADPFDTEGLPAGDAASDAGLSNPFGD